MRTKNIILIIITIALGILTVMFIGSLGMSFGMQKKQSPMVLSSKFDSLQSQIQKRYGLKGYQTVFNSGYIHSEITENDIQDCRKNEKTLIFTIKINDIQNPKYKNEKIMQKEADSLYHIINKYLPNKECIDSIYIGVYSTKNDSLLNNVGFENILKYPVVKY